MYVTAFHTLDGTVNYMFAHCVDKDSLDMVRKIVLTDTMMMELEAILTLGEGRPVTIAENVETPTSFTYLFWNLMVRLKKFLLPFSSFHFSISICFPFLSLEHLNSFLQLLYWSWLSPRPLNNTIPLLF